MQFSLFGAEASAPRVEDLAGVLIGGGQWGRDGGQSVRLSVLVDAPWRQAAMLEELAARGIAGERFADPMLHDDDGAPRLGVRTGFDPMLEPLSRRWLRGAVIAPPPDLALNASAVRLWAMCAGQVEDAGYLLRTRDQDSPAHRMAGAQLSRLGVAAVSVGVRGRCGWRVTGARRRHRLAELVGAPPVGCDGHWPSL